MMSVDNSIDLLRPVERARMEHRKLTVMSKGNVSATFQVPGIISIPSDGNAHNVTIAQLKLNATMSWVCVPKVDTKVHLKVSSSSSLIYTH